MSGPIAGYGQVHARPTATDRVRRAHLIRANQTVELLETRRTAVGYCLTAAGIAPAPRPDCRVSGTAHQRPAVPIGDVESLRDLLLARLVAGYATVSAA